MKMGGVMLIHNEERYLPYVLNSIKDAPLQELIVVLDNCADKSEQIIKGFNPNYPMKVYKKNWRAWHNPIAEVSEYAFSLVSKDMDVVYLLAGDLVIDPKSFGTSFWDKYDLVTFHSIDADLGMNTALWFYELALKKIYNALPNHSYWIGGLFAMKRNLWEQLHFNDVKSQYGEHSQFLDFKDQAERLGHKYGFVKQTKNLHLKCPIRTKERQLQDGMARAVLGYKFGRVLLHSLIHFKPYLIIGYLRSGKS